MGEGARAACVVGWPVRHSRSPVIHGHWIEQYRLDAVYRREEIAPESFADFIARLSERQYQQHEQCGEYCQTEHQ